MSAESSVESPAAPERLPLTQGAVAWCDPELVKGLLETGLTYRQHWPPRPPHAFPDMQDGINAVLDENQHHRSRWGAFVRARKALEADFRCRIADGRLQLVGLSIKPVPADSLSAVPMV